MGRQLIEIGGRTLNARLGGGEVVEVGGEWVGPTQDRILALADEVGPRGIRVNGLLPGSIDTDRVRELDAASPAGPGARAHAEEGIPLRRYGEPAEFGRVAAFVLSPASSYVTGAMVVVDGGVLRAL